MKNKRNIFYSLLIVLAGLIYFTAQAQQKKGVQNAAETQSVVTSYGPNSIVRTIKQDRKGNIWMASWRVFLNTMENLLQT